MFLEHVGLQPVRHTSEVGHIVHLISLMALFITSCNSVGLHPPCEGGHLSEKVMDLFWYKKTITNDVDGETSASQQILRFVPRFRNPSGVPPAAFAFLPSLFGARCVHHLTIWEPGVTFPIRAVCCQKFGERSWKGSSSHIPNYLVRLYASTALRIPGGQHTYAADRR